MSEIFGVDDENPYLSDTEKKHKIVISTRKQTERSKVARGSQGTKVTAKTLFRKVDKIVDTANTVEIPQTLLDEINQIVERESSILSSLILKEGLAPLLAYRHALVYSSIAARDGLKLEAGSTDNEVDELFGNMIKIRVLEYLIKKTRISLPVREKLMARCIAKVFGRDTKFQISEDDYPVIGVVKP